MSKVDPSAPWVRVWDPVVRLFHWSLVIAFAVGYVTQVTYYEPHNWAGYIMLGLIAIRVLWGFVGPRRARFTSFVKGPRKSFAYLGQVLRGRAARHLGHNPAGGAMILALLVCLVVLGVSGVALDAAENRAGPLAGFGLFRHLSQIEATHEVSTNVALALIVAHVLGVVATSFSYGENLVRAMVTGRKRDLTRAIRAADEPNVNLRTR